MIRYLLSLILFGLLLFFVLRAIFPEPASAAPPPSCIGAVPACDQHQQRDDIFPCDGCRIIDQDGNGIANMQDLNPTTLKAKATRAIAYRVLVMPACSAGSIPADLEAMNRHVADVGLGLALSRNDGASDFNVKIDCGLEQIAKCGGVNVYCLPDGFPYVTDVYLSDVMSSYQPESRLSIPLHEILGHAIGSWNEQYALCGASCGFASTDGLRDVMNTGPLSRHGLEAVELARWQRTMWSLAPVCVGDPCWHDARWWWQSGWSVDPATDTWYDPRGRAYWGPRQWWGGRCDLHGICLQAGSSYYDQDLGDPWLVVP